MQCYIDSYTGDGNDDRSISGVGFQPDLVIIKGDTAQRAVFRTSAMAGDATAVFTSNVALFADGIQALEVDGFQVGQDAHVNSNGVAYHYAAFRDDGTEDFEVGSYTGDGNDDRNLDVLDFQPTFLVVKATFAQYAVWRVDENAADSTLDFWASTNSTNQIQAFRAAGFQVGGNSAVNTVDETYHYFAFKDVSGYFDTGTYEGDGNDDRSIAVGFAPNMVWVKGDIAENGFLRTDTMDAGESAAFQNAACVLDCIQSFPTTNFQVGTDATVNTNEIDYFWAAWKVTGTTVTTTGYMTPMTKLWGT